METIESILLSRGELDRICRGNVRLFLWRALHKANTTTNHLHPDFVPREVRGILRAPDVTVEDRAGIPYVVAKLGQGTSLFNKPGVFGSNNWSYFKSRRAQRFPTD